MPIPRPVLSRRTLLLAGAALLGTAGTLVTRALRGRGPGSRAVERRLVACFAEPKQSVALGRKYLDHHPDEADRERLVALLNDELGELGVAESDERLRERVTTAVRADFAAERTVQVDGWTVSRTEARLAALLFLQPHSPA